MARLAAIGDSHLGRTHYAHLRDEEGRNQREEDFARSFEWAVGEAIAREPDAVLWLGDIFDTPRPSYRMFTRVVAALRRLEEADVPGVALSGNHDTPRLRGTGSPYAALEEVFPGFRFAWAMRGRSDDLAGVRVHAVPQTLTVEDFKTELDAAASRRSPDLPNLLLAHVALTSLPQGRRGDMNELEVDESVFAAAFDLVLLGHYHVFQEVSKRTWYPGATDAFNFSDRPRGAGPKGFAILDTDGPSIEHVANPHERPLLTFGVDATGMGPSDLVAAAGRHAGEVPRGAIVRLYLNDVDPAALRQLGLRDFADALPPALHVQVEPDYGAAALPAQGGAEIGTLELEWRGYLETQDLAGLDRDRVRTTGERLLLAAQGEDT